MPASRQSLLIRVRRSHDHQVWHEFADLYGTLVARYAQARGVSASTAAQLAEQCLVVLNAHLARPDFEPSPAAFKHWLRTMAEERIEQCLHSSDHPTTTPTETCAAAASSAKGQTFEQVWRDAHRQHCLAQLRIETDSPAFDAFCRLVVDAWPIERVGATFGLSLTEIRSIQTRFAARLRRLMAELTGDEQP